MSDALLARKPTVGGSRSIAEWLEQPRREPAWRRGLARACDALASPDAVLSFREFVTTVNPRFIWYDHCARLAAVLQRVVDGDLARLIVAEPPRHGKSEMVSRLLPAYYLYRFPDRFVGLASYGAELAYTLSRNARDNYVRGGGRLRDDAAAVKHWETTSGGGLWATGARGPATGKGGHLLLIDDPIKDSAEAASDVVGRGNQDWYRSTWSTRCEPGGAMIVMQTRWPGPGDMIGWLLEEEMGEEPEHWHVVSFEAVKEADPPKLPSTCVLEPDPRQPGEALCPERYNAEKLKQLAARVGPYFFGALYQQRPVPRGGEMFPRDRARIIPAVPAGVQWIRSWDKAATDGGGAYTAGVKLGITAEQRTVIAHVERKQLGSDARKRLMRSTAVTDGIDVRILLEQEPGSGGKDSTEADIKLLSGFPVEAKPATGDKVARADAFAAQWQAGNVDLVVGEWNKEYLDELEHFPHGKYKDQTDASAAGYNKLTLGSEFFIA